MECWKAQEKQNKMKILVEAFVCMWKLNFGSFFESDLNSCQLHFPSIKREKNREHLYNLLGKLCISPWLKTTLFKYTYTLRWEIFRKIIYLLRSPQKIWVVWSGRTEKKTLKAQRKKKHYLEKVQVLLSMKKENKMTILRT